MRSQRLTATFACPRCVQPVATCHFYGRKPDLMHTSRWETEARFLVAFADNCGLSSKSPMKPAKRLVITAHGNLGSGIWDLQCDFLILSEPDWPVQLALGMEHLPTHREKWKRHPRLQRRCTFPETTCGHHLGFVFFYFDATFLERVSSLAVCSKCSSQEPVPITHQDRQRSIRHTLENPQGPPDSGDEARISPNWDGRDKTQHE